MMMIDDDDDSDDDNVGAVMISCVSLSAINFFLAVFLGISKLGRWLLLQSLLSLFSLQAWQPTSTTYTNLVAIKASQVNL